MNITNIRRNVADTYIVYALALKLSYISSIGIGSTGHQTLGLALFSLTIVLDLFTDFLVYDTVRRSRKRLVGLRAFVYKYGGLKETERFLQTYAFDLASRGGNLEHWEKRFALVRNMFERIGHKRRGDGRLMYYLPQE